MSSIVNKVKDALQSDKNAETQHNTTTSTHPHGTTGTTEPRVNTTSHHAPHAPQDGTYAAGDNYTRGTTGPAGGLNTGRAPTTAGPHSSNLANKVDPRVDSDLSGSNTQPITHEAYGNNKPGGIAGTAGGLSTGPASGTAGPHSSNLVNKADPRIDSDLDGRNTRTTHGTTHGNTHTLGTSGAGGSTGAAYGTTGHGNTTAGPHSSNLANKADPRVDSDFDGRNTMGSTTHGTHGTTHSTTHGTHGTAAPLAGAGAAGVAGAGAYSAHTGPASNTAGPHSSNLANKVDPRVDSDLDGSKQLGSNNNNNNNNTNTTTHNPAYGTTQGTTHGTHGTQGTHGTHGSGIPLAGAGATGPGATMGSTTHGTTHGTTGTGNASGYNYNNTAGSTNAGPHSSNLANKVDPRVDSDRDGRTAAGSNTHGTHGTTHGTSHGTHGAGAPLAAGAGTAGVAGAGTHAIGGNHGVAGTHGTHGANTGIAGTQGTHSNTTGHHSAAGTGPAPNTAGPHKSDLLNKLDPRVDSNLDGSKTVGGNKTHQSNRDPTDASQVPPSVMQQHIGGPEIHHDDHTHDRERRHSVSHQANHRGL